MPAAAWALMSWRCTFWPFDVCDQAFIEEQIRELGAFFGTAGGAMAHIQDQLLGALLLQVFYLRGDIFQVVAFEARHLDQADLIGQHLRGNCRNLDRRARQLDFLRLRLAKAQHADFDGAARITLQQNFSKSQRHIAGGDAVNGFKNVRGSQTGLRGR